MPSGDTCVLTLAFGWLKQEACGTTYPQRVVLMADMGKIFLLWKHKEFDPWENGLSL